MSAVYAGMTEPEIRDLVERALERGWCTRPGYRPPGLVNGTDKVIRLDGARAAATAEDLEDRARATFLQRLADSPIEVTDTEADFVAEMMSAPWGFNSETREATDALRTKYEGAV